MLSLQSLPRMRGCAGHHSITAMTSDCIRQHEKFNCVVTELQLVDGKGLDLREKYLHILLDITIRLAKEDLPSVFHQGPNQ